MASPHSERAEYFPKIPKQRLVEAKPAAQLTYLEDSGVDVGELWRDHGNERQLYRNSPPMITGQRKSGSQTSSRTSSPVQRRNEAELSLLACRSPSITLELGSSVDESQLLRDKISRLHQEREHLSTQLSHYRQAAETAQTDLAAEKVVSSGLQQELRDAQHRISEKEQQMIEFKCEIESNKQNAARQTALVQSLRDRIREAEDQAVEKENFANRSDVTISSMRKEMHTLQDRLQQVESSLKHHIAAEEEATSQAKKWESKYGEMRTQFIKALQLDLSEAASTSMQSLLGKVAELVRERNSLQEKANSLSRNLHESNLESKASRETIMRLVSEVGQEKKSANQSQEAISSLTRERDVLQQTIREREIETDRLKHQLAASQDAWSVTKKQLDEKQNKLTEMEQTLQTSEYTGQSAHSRLHNFKRHLAELIGDTDESVAAEEEIIVSRVKILARDYRDLKGKEESLRVQLKNLSDELESQRNLHRTTLKRANEAESQLKENQERVTGLEGELLTSDVERDQMKEDKRKFVSFCEKLARVMKLDEIANDVGLDVNGDALLARGEQLVKLETDALDDRKTTIYNLQRRVKWSKQQIESKDLHLGLLKKKVNELEDLLREKGRVEVERDENSLRYKKLVKHNDKLQRELLDCKKEITSLKAKLLEASELRVRTLEQGKTIEELENTVNKLAKSKHKTNTELHDLRNELEMTETEAREKKAQTSKTLQQLSSELQTTKQALDESRDREKQLLDFRQVLARLLGLDINTLSVPDYEIISRLERLVQAHHAHSITTHSLEASLQDMESGFRAGYDDAVAILRTPSPVKVS
ncbi:coiled-coil domain-containing protein 170-like [Acropora millepora]|uniref:coiled-coil domain-containing protein 170-like n=1 Tax=Acropora millepora TaxID=45264 RepID=UPI001CF39613|nr:coiled-coil domain-containing protein 170-like [Acropora millepora]